MKAGRLEFDYKELMDYLYSNSPSYEVPDDGDRCEGYSRCTAQVEQFFLDKLKLKVAE